MQVIILCGGKGTRLFPLTKEVQKCMLEIKGKPVLEYQIEFLKKQGFKDIVLAVGYLKEQIINYFGDGSKFGVKINYSTDNCLGTGGAIKCCNLKETFIVMNGDTLIDINLKDLLKCHNQLVTITIKETKNCDRYGVIVNGKFNEKIKLQKGFVSCGVYVINPSILEQISPNKYCSLENEIFPNTQLGFYEFNGDWIDMGTFKTYNELR